MPFYTLENNKIQSVKLEFNLANHCNFSCDECSHFSPHMRPKFSDLSSFKRDINLLSKVYHVKRFRFVGGEPFLHKRIEEFIDIVRDSGICEKIQVCSNGALGHKISNKIYKKLDMLSISWYPDSRVDEGKIDLIKEKCHQYDTKLKIEKIDTFRLMQMDTAILDEKLVKEIYDTCQMAHTWGCQTFYEGKFYMCSRPIFTKEYLNNKNITSNDFSDIDGISLGEPDLKERIMAYLDRSKPLNSCNYCLGSVGKVETWRALEKNERISTIPLNRLPEKSIDNKKVQYLLRWKMIEDKTLRIFPSLYFSRILNLIKNSVSR